jgi:hypothetical protein
VLPQVKSEFPGVMIIDYTLPTSVNGELAAGNRPAPTVLRHCFTSIGATANTHPSLERVQTMHGSIATTACHS